MPSIIPLIALISIAPQPSPPRNPYLFEQLRNPIYKATFNGLFKGQSRLEPWLRKYLRDRDGVDSPGETTQVAGMTCELYSVCKPHQCPGNVLVVLFQPGGAKAWAMLTANGKASRYFGNPDREMEATLRSLAK